MSIHVNAQHEKRDKAKAKKQLPLPWAMSPDDAQPVSWDDVDPLLVAYVVQAACGAGTSVQFTTSRDEGALGVRVYDETLETKTTWARPNEGLEALLLTVGDYYRKQQGLEVVRW